MENLDRNEFEYQGYHFIPVKRLQSDTEIDSHIFTEKMLGMNNYHFDYSRIKWDYDEFYRASGSSEYDVFQCIENGILYIPGEHELFGWSEEKVETGTVRMNSYVLNVIHAVLDYRRYISSHYAVNMQKDADIEADTRKYYFSLPLPFGMKNNNQDFERVMSYRFQENLLRKMDEMTGIELSTYLWKE